ncbi:DUF1272 domain-containing protein [Streptomyces sp. 5112.2]|uniref:DUF1272 domain-containing protein n=1 Tax=unclassified Streptomyces TaxID=2593676 RepID=UPI000A6EDA51|nr:DUF1272 domain-containing protein [Streptomyces sp. 5112.2]
MSDASAVRTPTALPADGPARVCSSECTFCVPCAEAMDRICPHCGGEPVPRPRRTAGTPARVARAHSGGESPV